MLKTLYIKNFTLIDELEVAFDKGLNILTGETGAGKSILIDAIDLALGARSSKDQIKTGEQKSLIELVVELPERFPQKLLEDNGIDIEEGNILVFSREILKNATRSRINGAMVTQNVVQEVRKYLLDIHSQHQTYTYIQPKTHIDLLDNYGDIEHAKHLKDFENTYIEYTQKQKEFNVLQSQAQSSEQKQDFLKFQISEIEQAEIDSSDELEELKEQREVLVNAEELKNLTYSGYAGLYGQENSIIDVLNSIESSILKACEFDKNLTQNAELIAESSINLKEAADNLRGYSENLEVDEHALLQVEERIDLLDKLRRKYGPELEHVLENCEKFKSELNDIEFSSEKLESLEKEITVLEKQIEQKAKFLSDLRKDIAKKLSTLIQEELKKLEMPKVKFEINIKDKDLNSKGMDDVEFLITTNPGEPLKPLAKVASGGEISRVMLAMKTIFAKSDNIDTVIFDEIDSGISGKTSQAVAQELCELSKTHQIICITHQPIIAATADSYFYIEKIQKENMTQSKISTLEKEEKEHALAKLASGQCNDESLSFAKQLLDKAELYKN